MIVRALYSDVPFGGRQPSGLRNGAIYGTVQAQQGELLQHVWRRVCLFIQRDGAFVAQTWSDKVTGAYRFEYLDAAETYFVIAFDHTGAHQPAVADSLKPELMV